jgi:diguanylate cyclase (GGDEF)-like protein
VVLCLVVTLFFATLQARYVIGVAPFPSMYLFPAGIGVLFGILIGRIRILNGRLERAATSDALTGLPNRLSFQDALTRELRRAERYGSRFSLLMLDIDWFKRINDTRGHQAGDATLVGLARILDSAMRDTDLCARWGGEEFVVLLVGTPLDGARIAAERLRKQIEDGLAAGGVTCSFGVAEFRAGDDDTTLVARADAALYQAKTGGRNRVAVSEPLGRPPAPTGPWDARDASAGMPPGPP